MSRELSPSPWASVQNFFHRGKKRGTQGAPSLSPLPHLYNAANILRDSIRRAKCEKLVRDSHTPQGQLRFMRCFRLGGSVGAWATPCFPRLAVMRYVVRWVVTRAKFQGSQFWGCPERRSKFLCGIDVLKVNLRQREFLRDDRKWQRDSQFDSIPDKYYFIVIDKILKHCFSSMPE